MKYILGAILLAATTVTIWTDPVLVAIESYAKQRLADYGGPLPGIAEELANKVELTVIDDQDLTSFQAALDDGISCKAVATWLCENKTAVTPVDVVAALTWDGAGIRYCAGQCAPGSSFYAFVALIGP